MANAIYVDPPTYDTNDRRQSGVEFLLNWRQTSDNKLVDMMLQMLHDCL